MKRSIWLAALAVASVSLLAACGGELAATPTSGPGPDPTITPTATPTSVPTPTDTPAPTPTGGSVRERLDQARQRWMEQGYNDYDLTYQRDCFCPEEWRGPVIVSVRDGEIVSVVYE